MEDGLHGVVGLRAQNRVVVEPKEHPDHVLILTSPMGGWDAVVRAVHPDTAILINVLVCILVLTECIIDK